ncbi:MAG: NAD(P)H-hydrate dehydratase [Hyphomonadaceae bacterium]|nr:NAD(P)H-hydrate dehydratase [Hyphomonadaceae bacterium]
MSPIGREIVTNAEMRAIDARAAALDVPIATLMENAGESVGEQILARYPVQNVAVLCGPGNNGGDGFVVARMLKRNGWPVWVETLDDPLKLKGAAAEMAARWNGETRRLSAKKADADLYVDALFGAGLSRALDGEAAKLADLLALTPQRVVAIDVPSGLHGDLGKPLGEHCFRAALTVTFVRKRPAHVLLPGRAICGEVVVADIGVPRPALVETGAKLWENGPPLWDFPWPDLEAHKHARGHVLVISGPATRTGAARLAARGALRIGAGLVTILAPKDAVAEHAAQLNAIMLRNASSADEIAAAGKDATCAVIGPAGGVDEAMRAKVKALAKTEAKLVLDADALTAFAEAPKELYETLRPDDVITPHIGEFRRVFPDIKLEDRINAARKAAALCGASVLLKGPDTVIASADGRAIVNTSGVPFLATAGSGDVLAGMIAGLVGQGMASFEAAAAGAWLHGRAGEHLGTGLIAEDLPEALPGLLAALWRDQGLG